MTGPATNSRWRDAASGAERSELAGKRTAASRVSRLAVSARMSNTAKRSEP